MKILLFSCPDATHPLFPRFSKNPQLGLCMLAAAVKDLAEVKVADLSLRREDVRAGIREAMAAVQPDLVGISAMTFQYETAKKIGAFVRSLTPGLPLVLGGYHASLAYEDIARDPGQPFDFISRGEGEVVFRELVLALSRGGDPKGIPGLSARDGDAFRHNPPRPVEPLAALPLPDRGARLWQGYHIFEKPFDHIESSRGCTMPCTFCSITRHYGRNYRTYDIPRIIADVRAAYAAGGRELFFVDDNITLDVKRFEAICDALIALDLPDLEFTTQGSVAGFYDRPELIRKMARAGFNLVFLGIENMSPRNLAYYKKGEIAQKTEWVLRELHAHDLMVMGGFILGSPTDTREDILHQFEFMRKWSIDSFLIQILTPYPGTPLTEGLERDGYIVNRDLRRYSGFFATVRTDTLSSYELDFIKWKHQPYYRDPKWFFTAPAAKLYPWQLVATEFRRRALEYFTEKFWTLLGGEKLAFRKYMAGHLNANCFFGEKIAPEWPDLSPAPAGDPRRVPNEKPACPAG